MDKGLMIEGLEMYGRKRSCMLGKVIEFRNFEMSRFG